MQRLLRQDIIRVIEGKGHAYHVPMIYGFWTNPKVFKAHQTEAQEILNTYPEDMCFYSPNMPDLFNAPKEDRSYRYMYFDGKQNEQEALDKRVCLEDFEDVDKMIADFPSFNYKNLFTNVPEENGQYRVVNWWYWLFERHWSIRGMENALMDFYLYPDEVHQLYGALTDFYMGVIERAKKETNADAFFVSDDIGTQKAPFFSREIFVTFFKPYYKKLIDKAHSLHMHAILHSCGNILPFMDDLIEIGLDVLHPIQKYTMEEKEVAQKYGDKICILAGFDVQQVIPYGSPQDVRNEVRHLMDTYYRKDGRFMITAGNGITEDCKIESFKALVEESYTYGKQKCEE